MYPPVCGGEKLLGHQHLAQHTGENIRNGKPLGGLGGDHGDGVAQLLPHIHLQLPQGLPLLHRGLHVLSHGPGRREGR